MFCTACGTELKDEQAFCSKCGKSTGKPVELPEGVSPPPPPPPPRRLVRIMKQKKIAGVCAGLAHYFNIDVTLVRVIWVLLVLCAGTGLLAYIVLWIVMPQDSTVQI